MVFREKNSQNLYYFPVLSKCYTDITYLMDNKSKTSLFGNMKNYIVHEDEQCNTYAKHSYNIVTFIHDIFFCHSLSFPIKYVTKRHKSDNKVYLKGQRRAGLFIIKI